MERVALKCALLVLMASSGVQAQESPSTPPLMVAGEFRYEVTVRELDLGRRPDVQVHSSVETWQVAEPAADGTQQIRMQRDQCALDEAASTPDPKLHARLRELADVLCGQPVHMQLGPDGIVVVGNSAQLVASVRQQLAAALAPSAPAGAGLEPAFIEETIDAVANREAIEVDIGEGLARVRFPTTVYPAAFADEGHNPLDGALIRWDHRVTQLPDDGDGVRVRWTAQPDKAAVQASLQALADSIGSVTAGATHNLARAVAGDRELGITRDYRLDAAGRVLDSTSVTVRRLGDVHERLEEIVRLLEPSTAP